MDIQPFKALLRYRQHQFDQEATAPIAAAMSSATPISRFPLGEGFSLFNVNAGPINLTDDALFADALGPFTDALDLAESVERAAISERDAAVATRDDLLLKLSLAEDVVAAQAEVLFYEGVLFGAEAAQAAAELALDGGILALAAAQEAVDFAEDALNEAIDLANILLDAVDEGAVLAAEAAVAAAEVAFNLAADAADVALDIYVGAAATVDFFAGIFGDAIRTVIDGVVSAAAATRNTALSALNAAQNAVDDARDSVDYYQDQYDNAPFYEKAYWGPLLLGAQGVLAAAQVARDTAQLAYNGANAAYQEARDAQEAVQDEIDSLQNLNLAEQAEAQAANALASAEQALDAAEADFAAAAAAAAEAVQDVEIREAEFDTAVAALAAAEREVGQFQAEVDRIILEEVRPAQAALTQAQLDEADAQEAADDSGLFSGEVTPATVAAVLAELGLAEAEVLALDAAVVTAGLGVEAAEFALEQARMTLGIPDFDINLSVGLEAFLEAAIEISRGDTDAGESAFSGALVFDLDLLYDLNADGFFVSPDGETVIDLEEEPLALEGLAEAQISIPLFGTVIEPTPEAVVDVA
ncbi:hypothetical protein [Parvularcula bermudensis]|nr:hypothetical protein [Parvularcula bermudensis]